MFHDYRILIFPVAAFGTVLNWYTRVCLVQCFYFKVASITHGFLEVNFLSPPAASGEFVGVVEGTGSGESSIVQWKNGTLWIGRSARGHEGRYLCEAGNGVPPGLSKLVDITVNGVLHTVFLKHDVPVSCKMQ